MTCPRWLGRLVYAVRGRRLVRIHCVLPGANAVERTFEGILVGRWAGHYILEHPKVLQDADTVISTSGTFEIPAESVFIVEVLAKGARW